MGANSPCRACGYDSAERESRIDGLVMSSNAKDKLIAELQERFQDLRLEHERWLWEFDNVHAPVFRANIERAVVAEGRLEELLARTPPGDGKEGR